MPMEDLDTRLNHHLTEEELWLHEVIQGDAELLFLDCCLKELLQP